MPDALVGRAVWVWGGMTLLAGPPLRLFDYFGTSGNSNFPSEGKKCPFPRIPRLVHPIWIIAQECRFSPG